MYCKHCGTQLDEGQDICPNCGVVAGNGNHYCKNCGKSVSEGAAFCANCGEKIRQSVNQTQTAVNSNTNSEAAKKLEKRDLVMAIVLSVITCGIYGIYWFIVLTDDVNTLCPEDNDFSGVVYFLLSLVTCGIFSIIWAYRMGAKVDKINNTQNGYSAILYLFLCLFGFGIVNYALIQDNVNKAIDRQ